ncbi:hypothetical protein BB561_006013 [Smittium simulii]|uniref:Mitotic-spindle organizing protein 1 n=1 Tax=Smittium simulii TaxID=133385 RepID=A0A2T9Y742_9FUNG|nr:hypothetical protein BB561_006013 [Smittium simulii]
MSSLGPHYDYIVEGLTDISDILDSGLSKEQIESILKLLEHGANPSSLAAIIKELIKERPLN